jgi:hypothetical protein
LGTTENKRVAATPEESSKYKHPVLRRARIFFTKMVRGVIQWIRKLAETAYPTTMQTVNN